MRDEQWEQIKPAAEAYERAKAAYEAAGMMNRPADPREAMESALRYERLRLEMASALRDMEAVKRLALG